MFKKLTPWILSSLFVVLSPSSAAETPQVGEMFFCTFHDGKSWDDFDNATALYNAAIQRIDGWDQVNAYVWRPYRARVDYDFIWASYTPNLNAWARAEDAYRASDAGLMADALWETVARCDSGLTLVEQIHDSEAIPSSGSGGLPSALESYVCNRTEGTTAAELRSAIEVWQAHAKKLGLEADVYMRTPYVMPPRYDHTYFSVYKDLGAWAANSTNYETDPGSAAVNEALNAVQSCSSALWTSWQVVPAAD